MGKEDFIPVKTDMKIVKSGDRYTMKRTDVYPLINAQNMFKSWKSKCEKIDEQLRNFNDIVNNAIKERLAEIDGNAQSLKVTIEEDLSKPVEQLKDELYKERLNEIDKVQEEIKNIDDIKAKAEVEIKEYFNKQRGKLKDDKKDLEEAIKVWSNPTYK